MTHFTMDQGNLIIESKLQFTTNFKSLIGSFFAEMIFLHQLRTLTNHCLEDSCRICHFLTRLEKDQKMVKMIRSLTQVNRTKKRENNRNTNGVAKMRRGRPAIILTIQHLRGEKERQQRSFCCELIRKQMREYQQLTRN